MRTVEFPYGKGIITHSFGDELIAVPESGINEFDPKASQEELIRTAMEAPIGSPKLEELSRGKKSAVIIASDHTRPVPSKLMIPLMLEKLRAGSPDIDITVLVATGCHRGTTEAELRAKFGDGIFESERIVVHDCDDEKDLVCIGRLPSGGECRINRIALETELLVSEGFIEPHFFAGFSGGRKSVLPGIGSRSTVLANHCSEFIDHPDARTGSLEGNPIHRDMLWAAKTAGLRFILNVVLNKDKRVIHAVAGDPEAAHKAGTDFLISHCEVKAAPADIVISTNGGYPLDQNVYQAVKGMTAAEATVKDGGVIIMLAECGDGVGGDAFYHQLADEADIEKTMRLFRSRGRTETVPDQWQTQILLRILKKARVILISKTDDETVRRMHMIPAHTLEEALTAAKALAGKPDPTVTAIPDGVSVIVR